MQPEDEARLRHMLEVARDAGDFVHGRSRAALDTDRMLVLALVKAIEIVGEAAFQVSIDARGRLPNIPWTDLVGMRHRLVHAYFDVNLDILWQTVWQDLPPLIAALKAALIERRSQSQ